MSIEKRTHLDDDPQFCLHDLAMLIQIFCLAVPYQGLINKDSGATEQSIAKLTRLGLIEIRDAQPRVTDRGEVYLRKMQHIPLPTAQWGYPE